MDFKYLSSYANKDNKGSIKDITARGNVPRSHFGSISSYGKYDNIFEFKTNFRSTQLKKPQPTKKIIQETNDEIKKKDTDGKKIGITVKENKSVSEFQDTFIPDIEKKPYVDPQYYQHNLGRKNFYSKFRDKIRRKEAKGEIETDSLSGLDSEEEETETPYSERPQEEREREADDRRAEEEAERIKKQEEEHRHNVRLLTQSAKKTPTKEEEIENLRKEKELLEKKTTPPKARKISTFQLEDSESEMGSPPPREPLKRGKSTESAKSAKTRSSSFDEEESLATTKEVPIQREEEPQETAEEISETIRLIRALLEGAPEKNDVSKAIEKATIYATAKKLDDENKKNLIDAVLKYHGITAQHDEHNKNTDGSLNVPKLRKIYKQNAPLFPSGKEKVKET